MKNKIINTITAAAVCGAMLTSQAFAEDITTYTSIYASNAEEVAERINEVLPESYAVYAKAETVMPVYHSSVYDYAKTGRFEFVPETTFGGQSYFVDTYNENGSFAGPLIFCDDGENAEVHLHMSQVDESFVLDYRANVDRMKELMEANNINTDITEAKIAWVTGLGFVYYINNGTDEVFFRVNFKGTADRYFTMGDGEFVVVNDEFRAMAEEDVAEMAARESLYKDGEEIPTGGTGGAPSTGGTESGIATVSVLAACTAALTAYKRKRK